MVSESPSVPDQQPAEAIQPPVVRSRLRVGLFGCPLNTGNCGVSALGLSTIDALTSVAPNADVTLFDFGRGTRHAVLPSRTGQVTVRQVGCFHSRRYYRFSNLVQMRVAARLGFGRIHPMLRRLASLDAILDISGGDSFSDIYGRYRFTGVTLPKLLALEVGVPLILLPQTYGPYGDPQVRVTAAGILRGARQMWARDAHSLEVAREMLGEAFDTKRHLCGVDMAFGLAAAPPTDEELVSCVRSLRDDAEVVVGLNISGMLYNNSGDEGEYGSANADRSRFGFLDSYVEIIDTLLRRLVRTPGVRVMLVPHVTGHTDPTCGDAAANRAALAKLDPVDRERVLLVPGNLGPMEVKWVIGQCDWFCGTRMHACIAALSQGVPAAAVAYSDKTRGVFDSAGIGEAVVDPRQLRQSEVVERLLQGLSGRDATAAGLKEHLPRVQRTLREQFRLIVGAVVRA